MDVVPHFPVTIRMPAKDGDIFSESAADSVVGQTFDFVDRPVRVTKAWVEDGACALMMTLEEVT